MASEMSNDLLHHPFWTLALSLIPLSFAVYGTVKGRVWVWYWIEAPSRTENPLRFWFAIGLYYVIFGLFILNAIAAISK